MPPAPSERDLYEEILNGMSGVFAQATSVTTLRHRIRALARQLEVSGRRQRSRPSEDAEPFQDRSPRLAAKPSFGPVDWPLKVTKSADAVSADAAAKASTDPPMLYVSDSRAVKFTSSATLGCFVSAAYEVVMPIAEVPPSGSPASSEPNTASVTLQIPSAVTAKPGYNEIVAQVRAPSLASGKVTCPTSGPTKSVALGILVVGSADNRQ